MSEPKHLHRASESEWYARALRERACTEVNPLLGAYSVDAELRVVFVLKGHYGTLGDIVEDFVGRVWSNYRVVEHCATRYGYTVTVEEGPADAP